MNQETLEHLAAQLVRDVDHLVAEGHISKHDAEFMKAKLRRQAAADTPIARTTANFGSLSIGGQSRTVKARAVWGYNENGSVRLCYNIQRLVRYLMLMFRTLMI